MTGMNDKMTPIAQSGAQVIMSPSMFDELDPRGVFTITHERNPETWERLSAAPRATLSALEQAWLDQPWAEQPSGRWAYAEEFRNTVVVVGKNQMLTAALTGAPYTVTGPYMGLISSVGYSAISSNDTMASHAGWTEAGNANAPQYTGNRKTCIFAAASSGAMALSAALVFTISSNGTIKGCFITYGAGAVNTIDSTAGVLFSAGLFTGGDRAVLTSDIVNVSYSISL
jgi:RimJ/RimL family protein N-acetyltransferase